MSEELNALVKRWKGELTYRDSGASARKTWQNIKKVATAEEQVQILEAQFIGK